MVARMGNNRLTVADIDERLSGRDVVMVGRYVNYHTKVSFRCNKGHTWMATLANVVNGTSCPHCSNRVPLTKQIVNGRIAHLGIVLVGNYVNTAVRAEFTCKEGHTWMTKPTNVLFGKGCPKCGRKEAARKKKLSAVTITERLAGRGIVMVGNYVTSHDKTAFQCIEGHTWDAAPSSVMSGNGCPHCAGRVPLTNEIVNDRISDRGIVLVSEYLGSNSRATFRCRDGHTWKASPGSIMQGSGCPYCDGQAPLSKEIVNGRIAERGLVMLGDYVNVDTKALFKCSEGHTWETTPYHVMSRTGCPYCSRQAPLTTEVVNARIANRGLILVDEFVTNSVKIRFKCDESHVWKAKPNNVLNGRGCPICSERSSDNDIFYLWAARDQDLVKLEPGECLLKHGVTSERLGSQRIREVANAWKITPRVLLFVRTQGDATLAEKTAGSIGQPLASEFSRLDGWTEFRIVNESELSQLMAIGEEAAQHKIIWDDPVTHIKEFRLV